jgi:hypothetical protein
VLPGPTANHRHWEDERSLQKPGKQNEKKTLDHETPFHIE